MNEETIRRQYEELLDIFFAANDFKNWWEDKYGMITPDCEHLKKLFRLVDEFNE